MFKEEEVKEATLEYFDGDELATSVWMKKYALRDREGNYVELTPDDMHRRLAKEFARIEKNYLNPLSEEEIYSYLKDFKYIVPQGSPMFGIGNDYIKSSLSNCVVISSPEDNMSSILNSARELANFTKQRCGVGVDISDLRPEGAAVSNAAITSSGAWSFADLYSHVTRMVGQNGRRGALMITLDIRHPDAEKFTIMKHDLSKVTGANVSLKITDEFMEAVDKDEMFVQQWPIDSDNPEITKEIRARDLWEVIVDSATRTAEPGLLMWDNILKRMPAAEYENFRPVTTNPCLSGDTRIAVADGRNFVSIEDLAKEGRDVPVYAVDPKTGLVEIKMGRNPRVTGFDRQIVRVWLDDGSYLDVTENHEFPLRSGGFKEAKELSRGDSLFRFSKKAQKFSTSAERGKEYYRVSGMDSNAFEHSYIAKFYEPDWFKTPTELSYWAANKCGIDDELIDLDPRVVKTLFSMEEQGYRCKIIDGFVHVEKTCEECESSFHVEHNLREQAFCSVTCGNRYTARKYSKKQTASVHKFAKNIAARNKDSQARIYNDLAFSLQRDPLMKEWEERCRAEGVPFRLKTKFGFQNFQEVKDAGRDYNHKVVKIEYLKQKQDVYNITVDDHHTVGIVTSSVLNKKGNENFSGIFVSQCGEKSPQ